MYAPTPRNDGRNLEFIELHNSQPWFQDLGGYRLTGAIEFTFPPNTQIASNSFLVVAKAPTDLQAVHGITNIIGPYAQDLPDDSGTIRLEHPNGGVLLEAEYSKEPPWPAAATAAGHSLVLSRPSLGERDPGAWSASGRIGGSPGTFEPLANDPLRAVVINEFLASGSPGAADFIELYNHSPSLMDVSGCILTDDPSLNKCTLPAGTTIPPGGLITIEETQLGFGLSRSGETLYLFNPDRTAVLDAVAFGPQAEGVACGRFPNGGDSFRPLVRPSPGGSNRAVLVSDVVINEIMYDPLSGEEDDAYVELYNQGSSAINVGGWRFVDGIDFEVPANTVMAAHSYLVVARNAARLLTNYAHLTLANTIGNFRGTLANRGERLALARSDGVVVDEVAYGVGGRWGQWAHGGGSSLELIDPRGDHAQASNWADSDESGKAPWTTVEFTGKLSTLGLDSSSLGLRSLFVILLGAGECLLDNVEVSKEGGANLVTNRTFQAGLTGWFGQGNHERMQLESTGFDDNASLRLCATDQGDTVVNRVGARLGPGLTAATTATLRAQARWLHGCPEILLRLIGNQLEAYGRLQVPANLGTPGAPNSRAVANAGPAISDVRHTPVLPATNQSFVVTAQVADPDGLSQVLLHYRIDPGTNLVSVPMTDDGLEGDAVAGDGMFTATIPGQKADSLVAFHISAIDQANRQAGSLFPSDAPGRECLARVGEWLPTGPFGAYRIWMTRATLDRWRKREPASNEPLDVTFVYGDARVVYHVGAYYSGSVASASIRYDSPIGNSCDYTLLFPETDRFLGVTDVRLSWPGAAARGNDTTLQTEQASFWLAEQLGLPTCHRRYVYLFVNGVRRGELIEDAQKPNGDYVAEWFPQEPDGELYKLLNHFEFDNEGRGNYGVSGARALLKISVPTNTPPERAYRWMWNKRATPGSQNDLRSVYELVEAFNLAKTQTYTDRIDALVELEQWMRTLAVERVVGNWDSFGFANDSNMYFYKPRGGKWRLCIWDMDLGMGLRTGNAAGGFTPQVVANLPQDDILSHSVNNPTFPPLTVSVPEIGFLRHPPFCRVYLRSLQALISGPMLGVNPRLEARQAIFAANGIVTESKDSKLADVKSYVTQRIESIRRQLAPYRVPWAIATPEGTIITNAEPVATLTGKASFELDALQVNGAKLPVTWTTPTNWSVNVPLTALTNRLTVAGYDPAGNAIPEAMGSVTVVYTGHGLPGPLSLFINEWMAANIRTLADPADGDYADWFEIYNPGLVAVDLFGYRLTDDPTNTVKFVIPAGWGIPPGGHLLVWADEKSYRNLTSTNLHVNFKLSRDGETIALYRPDGSLVDAIEFGPQTNDVSQGRWPDGAGGSFSFFAVPTPGSFNGDTNRPFQITSIVRGQRDELVLTWTAILGKRYRLQYKDRLADLFWQEGDTVVAAGSTASFVCPVGSATSRFYRLQLDPR